MTRIDPRFRFTSDWASVHYSNWRDWLAHLVGVPNVRIAEVGSWEGRSALWFAENIATGEGATVDCFDTWELGEIERHFKSNVLRHPCGWRVIAHKGNSGLMIGPYDAVYIDGDHSAVWVYMDALNADSTLKVGGVLIFDDYNDFPGVREAVSLFLSERTNYTIVFEGQQICVRKESENT